MNSWMSSGLSACAPPFTTFMSGTGSVTAPVPPTYRKSGSAQASAAARQTAIETPRIALAPSAVFISVPSSSIMRRSISACWRASIPRTSGAIVSFTFLTALRTPLPP